ncbi:flagellar hook-length control protein FliK (plasmid) [Pseudomonas luteola]|uniref:type III secretion system HrpP C-terminal domain-containing protein n=1 Tax=Pseudomonas TaxID=286 RepID=UPI0012398B35|nr:MULTISPECIES: type III secretion system HrpP C-terminal domain-containing protein [Pseudomonas]MBA1246289.1 flagellar hook-length control protein FliK [Pseudomonas zeshuii]QEU26991.1 flagellar hook-length control protein FliK [Pseudomonas luteola]
MKTEARPSAPPRPLSSPVSAPSKESSAPLLIGRRGENERLRSLSPEHETEHVLNADGLFFSQLIQPVSSDAGQQDLGGSAGVALSVQTEEAPAELIDELVQQLTRNSVAPLAVTVLMPNLGKVQVKVTRHNDHWGIELGFSRREILSRLRPHQRACESALTNALGDPVELSMLEEAYT